MTLADLLSWSISALVAATLVAFAVYLVGLRALPLDRRPLTAVYDRLGRQIGVAENPDYHENPGTEASEGREPDG